MRGHCDYPSSSKDSSSSPLSLFKPMRRDLSTDLNLGLSLSPSYDLQDNLPKEREKLSHWPPIKPLLRSTLEDKVGQNSSRKFFVKVYMEGVPIGRKLDLFAHNDYESLLNTLRCMFSAAMICPRSKTDHVLTYEDIEGDWMMVGDVPWEFFLSTVKKLKITRADKCLQFS
ncbi:hypothetical protein Cni_G20545 [Canna indica]|uniref:Auxin-responsive protein n=1 Tax=Canna indica TaxID=4628 RepID=A0AAQ3QGB6_9LILI|nr:hypothetical protein Cni_G20545 [Canna indica]